MPGGSEPLHPLQWQRAPGDGEAEVYPLTRKVDTISSNSFLVRTPEVIVLIDPGGLPEQAAQIASLVLEARAAPSRPLVIILTHAHVDHYRAVLLEPLLRDPEIAIVAAQEDGAGALESADRRMTQAEVLGQEIAPLRVDLRILRAEADGGGLPPGHTYPNGAAVTVVSQPPRFGLRHEELTIGSGTPFQLYHTPGHSPDSCCIRIGRVLFTGDLLLAASPGIAGIPGWDQEALIRSLAGVRALLAHGEVEVICPGHGRTVAADDGLRMLDMVERDARLLAGIAELDLDRARRTAAFAEDCMDQVNELFTVITGRLYYVSHVMDELGEPETAAMLHTLIRGDTIDDLLEAFDAFNREYHSGMTVPINLALKAGQVIGKLQRSFDQDELARIIDPTLVQRAERLLDDYTTMLRGFEPPRIVAVHDLRDLLEAVIAGHTVHPCSDEDLVASADDEAAFGRLLLARIGMPPLLGEVAVSFTADPGPLPALVDRERLLDLVTYLVEDLVGSGAPAIAIHARGDGQGVTVAISGADGAASPPGRGPRRFLFGLCERAGGALSFDDAAGSRRFSIEFASAI